MQDEGACRTAAIKLKAVEDALDDYNSFAMEHCLYVTGISGYPDELAIAKSGIPKEVADEVYKK